MKTIAVYAEIDIKLKQAIKADLIRINSQSASRGDYHKLKMKEWIAQAIAEKLKQSSQGVKNAGR